MPRRVCKSQRDLLDWARYLFTMAGDEDLKYPITCSWKKGDDRSLAQNALSHKWFNEVALFFGDRQAHEVKAHCKLNHGVKMLVVENEDFRAKWHSMILDRFSYEEKLAFMLEPFDFPVSRIMTTQQMTRYMSAIYDEFAAQGVPLTVPESIETR